MIISTIESDGYTTWDEYALSYHPQHWIDRLNGMCVSDLAIFHSMFELSALARCENKTQRYAGNEDTCKKPHIMDAEEPVLKRCKNY
jgi:hypothetical protein